MKVSLVLLKPARTPIFADSLAAVRAFMLAGYRGLEVVSGDFNRDASLQGPGARHAAGKLVALRKRSPALLLTGRPDGTCRLAARNDEAVMCGSCGGIMGDPLQQLVSKNGYFSVEHYGGVGWRWTHILTFKNDLADQHWYPHWHPGESENPRRNRARLWSGTLRELRRQFRLGR